MPRTSTSQTRGGGSREFNALFRACQNRFTRKEDDEANSLSKSIPSADILLDGDRSNRDLDDLFAAALEAIFLVCTAVSNETKSTDTKAKESAILDCIRGMRRCVDTLFSQIPMEVAVLSKTIQVAFRVCKWLVCRHS